MKFIFKDAATGEELALPVTPSGFEVAHGVRIETVNIHAVGDAIIGGYGTLCSIKVECMLPAQEYSFSQQGGGDPYALVERIKAWCASRAVLRFIVTGTPVNLPVLVAEIKYGERDGTGDVYATVSLREYRELAVVRTQKAESTGNLSRAEASPPKSADAYVVVKDDTLSAIARKFYGDGSLCYALAAYNGIKNANLIYPGQTIKLPDKSLLNKATASTPPKAAPAPAKTGPEAIKEEMAAKPPQPSQPTRGGGAVYAMVS